MVLLSHLDEERVRRQLPEEEINTRPTYHYRLPNSHVGTPNWSIGQGLRSWAMIEHLASDPELLASASADMLAQLESRIFTHAHPEADAPWLCELRRRAGPMEHSR